MEIENDPTASESQAAFAAALKELSTKVAAATRQCTLVFKAIDWDKTAESIRRINAKLAADSAKIAESFHRFRTGLPNKLKSLAMQGWFIYGFRTPSRAIYPIASLIEAGRIDEANQAMCSHFNNVLSDIESDLMKRFPKRAAILKKAFAAHRAGDYELSIPVMLAQADGIAHDTIGKNIPRFSIYTQFEPKKKEIKKAIDQFGGEALLGSAIVDVLLIKMPLNASESDAELIKGVLNRNQILHGVDTDYATLTDSCRAISWLDYVSYIHRLSSKRRNKLSQSGSGGCGQ